MGARDRSFWGDRNVPKLDGVSGCTAPVNLLKITELYTENGGNFMYVKHASINLLKNNDDDHSPAI